MCLSSAHFSLHDLNLESSESSATEVQTSFWQYISRTPRTMSSFLSHSASVEGFSSVRWALSPFMRKSAVMRDDQVGQLEPSSVSIAAEPEGGKLIEGA